MAEHDANDGTAPIGKAVLVTGATGKTGRHTVPLLLGRGHRVRALVHRLDGRSDALAALGADVVAGDLLDQDAVGRALAGIDVAYFCYPIEPGLLEATAVFAQAAREAGVSAIVNMSQISARRDAESDAARQHWLAERVFDWSGVPVTHLRPTFFAEWLLLFSDTIETAGIILALPFPSRRSSSPRRRRSSCMRPASRAASSWTARPSKRARWSG